MAKANDQGLTTNGHTKANDQRPRTNDHERGYILLMLMLFVALLAIAAGALAPSIAFKVRRDREEEMIHRGTQYSRAIRRYVKKTGRYPSRIEDLENTNNIRFLRRRYKDPVTGKDFKILHIGDVQLTSAAGIAGATAIGNGMAAIGNGASPAAALAGAAGGMMAGAAGQLGSPAATPLNPNAEPVDGQDASPDKPEAADQSKSGAGQPGSGSGSNQLSSAVFGGGPIVGVASISKATTIREFNHKNKYNQWQFIYDPTMDRGGLITTPAQPALQTAAPLQPQQNSSNPNSSSPNSMGTPGSFGGLQSTPQPIQPTQQPQ